MKDKLIGEILQEKGYCKTEDIEKALEIQANYGKNIRIGRVLINMGVINEEQLLDALATQFDIEFLPSVERYDDIVKLNINMASLYENLVFPVEQNNNYITVLTNDPLKLEIFSFIENITSKKVRIVLTTEENLETFLNKVEEISVSQENGEYIDVDEEIDKLKELASEAPVIKLVNSIISKAVEMNATDVHFESLKGRMRVRMRIDGVLRIYNYIPGSMKLPVIARLKLLSGMNIAESRLAQDGRISMKISGKNIDIRSSSLPTQHGESFVLRILLQENTTYQLDKLGFYEDHISLIRSITAKPNGIFLTTGPTGSGKTTTLYSILSELNSEKVKIITVEDPVEYELEGINQVQVKPEIGRTFASALRNILRQDPDIIMIGEIRDKETAEIAIQAALTGHLVLSTLHTNSALASITRLLDMGIEWFLIKASVIGLMAQRLVRTVCYNCAEDTDIPEEIIETYNIKEKVEKYKFGKFSPKKGKGCEICGFSGYKGRTVIAEVIPFNFDVQKEFEKNRNFNDPSKFGYRSMLVDGLLKAASGITTIDEVLRVV